MGMAVVLDVRDEPVDEAAVERCFAWLREVDARFSTYRSDSEISRLAGRDLALEDAHPDVRAVLARCEELRLETDGFFDVAFAGPGTLDPSGLVKGWAVDRGVSILTAAGHRNLLLNAGGDLRLLGGALPETTWRVGVQHPLEPHHVAAMVEGRDLAVATSGALVRGEHVLDPHRRRPPSGLLSVTVTGPELATADALATAAFAMGAERGPAWTARLQGYAALSILDDHRVLSTPGFPRAEILDG
jgi:thiamine biosynthesis lipoprotein